jgi:hypothetical protein
LVRGVDGRPTRLGSKNRSNGAKNTGSSNKATTRASSIDSRRSSFGKSLPERRLISYLRNTNGPEPF